MLSRKGTAAKVVPITRPSGRTVTPAALRLRPAEKTAAVTPLDYTEQCAQGRRQATDLMNRMSVDQAPYLLGYAVREMLNNGGPWTGVHVGFFHEIAERLEN